MRKLIFRAGAVAMLVAGMAAPLSANVRDGVDAWSRGDYAAAVAEWQGPAAAGDPDAQFNMAQAYRLGRGVAADQARAEQLYFAAAQAGHLQAADTYGLMLFQDGRREQALPYVQAASDRGDPRAQYLLGVAHFNGDLVPRDWERAYALLTLANSAGLPQAAAAIAQMDEHIPLEQRQSAVALARQLEDEAQAARSAQMAAADLGTGGAATVVQAPVAATPAPAPPPQASQRVPQAITSVEVSPSVAAARDAVAQARQATGSEDPAQAGASYARNAGTPRPVAEPPVQVAVAPPPPAPRAVPAVTAPPPAPTPAPTPAPVQQPAPQRASGPWRVQLGAFGVQGNAERLWTRLSGRPELAGRERLLVPAGRVTKLQAGGFATQAEAQAACTSLQRAGQDCIVTRN
ncbi:MAG: SPOR domain-containing protein [Erythrobacter sp.]|nr:SPOR domain-containing protein [Erythrobacter sp.]